MARAVKDVRCGIGDGLALLVGDGVVLELGRDKPVTPAAVNSPPATSAAGLSDGKY